MKKKRVLTSATYDVNNVENLKNINKEYVSEKRLFKTTVFTKSKQDIINLFKIIMPITKTNFLEDNISYTENSKRNHGLRKKQALSKTNLNPQVDLSPQEMILNSVFLQVNGLDRQIKIF